MNDVDVDGPGLIGPETVLSAASDDGAASPRERAPKPVPSSAMRYEAKGVLGAGGMGEVRLCRDRAAGREVAMKVMRPRGAEGADARWRFVREARVQAQLEHPAIVPVYDLGIDEEGRPTFTMQRVRGRSLAEVLRQLGAGNEVVLKRFPLRRLLSLLARLCEALEYVHSRGVVHRDVKPANVMLGEFGEVYLLDWGLAKVGAQEEVRASMPVMMDASAAEDTASGAILGTPGYMAPEQMREGVGAVGPWTDVYGLGLLLFEILAHKRVHGDGSTVERIVATLKADGWSPLAAAPDRDIAPELDRICVRATRRQPSERIQSARELGAILEAYLDGDRDAELRKSMALVHAESARAALARSNEPSGNEADERARAMREVGLALGMAPDDEGARRTLLTLLTSPPKVVPPEASRRVEEHFAIQRRVIFWGGFWNYLLTMVYVPLPLYMGVLSWPAFGVEMAAIATCFLLTVHMLWTRRDRSPRLPVLHLIVSSFTVLVSSTFMGPLIFVPFLALGNLMAYLIAFSRGRWFVVAASGLSLAIPLVLASVGWFPSSYEVRDGLLIVHPILVAFPPQLTIAFLLVTQVALLGVAGVLLSRLRDAYEQAEIAVELQKWQLEQMLPPGAPP